MADGVSGWNDYGFSSSMFSNQLMENCKTELEEFLIQSQQNNESKQILKKMRKKGSFLSMENLIEQADEEIA